MDDPFGCFVGKPVLHPGRPGALLVAIKDNIDIAGQPTGAGLGLPGRVAERDADVVARLRAAGTALLGKTRMDEAALGATGDNPHHGRTLNPRAAGCSPGGSSSGSAAAVAAGHCDAALGTDTLGSIRIPASYCGVVGLKPGRGVLPTGGIVPLSPTLDTVGILARTVDVTAAVLRLLGGPAEEASRVLRLGMPDALEGMALAPSVRAALDTARHWLTTAGWTVGPCAVPGWDPTATRRAGLLLAEAEGAEVHATLLGVDDPALSPALRALLRYGRDASPDRVAQARRTLHAASDGVDAALAGFDLLLLPTTAAPAFAWADGPPPGQADLTALANAGGHPAISVPIPGLALAGLQLVGPHGSEGWLLAAARMLEALPRPQ